MQQALLGQLTDELRTLVVARRSDFDSLFEGFKQLRAVTYVATPRLLLQFFERFSFEHVHLVLGESFGDSRDSLRGEGLDVVERLATHVEDGSLEVLVPDHTIHTKLYMLTKPGMVRLVQTSANLTETARRATSQTNYAWYLDLPDSHEFVKTVQADFDNHSLGCERFMDDLLELFRQEPDKPKAELIEAWLVGNVIADEVAESEKLLQEITEWAVAPQTAETEPILAIRLPQNPTARKRAERLVAEAGTAGSGLNATLNHRKYLQYVEKTLSVPMMTFDVARAEARLAVDGALEVVSVEPADAHEIDQALDHIERYVNTVDWGQAPDPGYTKMAMYEALLYMLAAPFAHEQMRAMYQRHGVIERRGPKFLYLYGQSSNGKTTFLQFALYLITGRHTRPLPASELTKGKIENAQTLRTCFPLIFDDVNPTTRSGFEDILKSHWEVWWKENRPAPQLIMSSNNPSLKEWAKSRVKRVDFDVHFVPSASNKQGLAELLSYRSPIFGWFSYEYLRNIRRLNDPEDDELHLTRTIFKSLYDRAGRSVPEFFPTKPLESIYDAGRMKWRDLVERSDQAELAYEKDRLTISLSEDLQTYEIRQYHSMLPQSVKSELRGRKIVIDNPDDFRSWFDIGRGNRTLLSRLLRR